MSKTTIYICIAVVLFTVGLAITLYLLLRKTDTYVQLKNSNIQLPPRQQYSGISPLS